MKLKLLPIALLSLVGLGLAACEPTVVSSSTINPTTTTTSEDPGPTSTTSENPVTTFEIANKAELEASWYVNQGNRQIRFNIVPAANVNLLIQTGELVIESSNTDVVSVSNQYLVPVAPGTATVTATYSGLSDTLNITILAGEYVAKLQEIREGIADGSITEGSTLSFNGIVAATMAESDIADGVYIQDGEYAIMLYSGTLEDDWYDNDIQIGDTVHVEGSLKPYNGLNEVAVSTLEKVEDNTIQTPVPLALNASNYSAEALTGQDGRLFVLEDAVYSGGSINVGSHSNVYFTIGTGEDAIDVTLRLNYHTGNDEMKKFKGIVDGLQEEDLVDLYGVIGWYNGPQLSPQFLADRDPSECIVPVEALANPTGITLTHTTTTVTAGTSITLTPTVTPDRSNHTVNWSVSDNTVAACDQNGTIFFANAGTVTVTATSAYATDVSGSITFTVEPDPNAPTLNTGMPVDGQEYLFGLFQPNLLTNLYSTGSNDGNYLATTSNYANAARFTAHVTSDNKVSLSTSDGQYLAIVQSGNYTNAQMSSTEFLFDYNSEYNTLTATFGETTYYVGTYNSYDTFSASNIDYASTSFPGHLYVPAPEPTPSELMATLDFSAVEYVKAEKTEKLTVEALQTILNSGLTVVDGKTLTVTVSSTDNIFAGNGDGGYIENQGGFLKAGTSSKNGSIVLNLSSEIVRVEIDCVKWNDKSSDEVTVNGVTLDAPAYENETFGTLGFNFSAATQLEITTAKRCFIKAIRVYCATTTVSE